MRVVVTGATGNVGTSVVERLAIDEAVTEIVGLARRETSWRQPKTEVVKVDVARDDLVPVFEGADVVIHLAWSFHPTHRPVKTWDNNVLGSMRVFDAVASAGVGTLVHASSVGAYSPGPADGRPVDESWPTHAMPTAAYGREKSYLERVLDTFEEQHPDVRVVRMRPGFIFKASSAEGQRRIFAGPAVPNPLVRNELIPVVPSTSGLRFQVLHSADAAEAYRLAATRDVHGAFNLAADPVIDAAVLGQLLDARPVPVPSWALRAVVAAAWRLHLLPASPYLVDLFLSVPVLDTTRARTELGWEPTVDALATMREFLDAFRRGQGGRTPPLEEGGGGALRHQEVLTRSGAVGGVTPDGR
jgi:UDP-glucose 4-epimerase